METSKEEVEAFFKRPKVNSFLEDLIQLCNKHKVSITTSLEGTVIDFHNWDRFIQLEADYEGASLYWPRIQTEIVVRRRKA